MKNSWLIFFIYFLINCSKTEEPFVEEETENAIIYTLGGTKNDTFNSVTNTVDGGYITAGFTQSNSLDITDKTDESFDFWVVKFSSENDLEWQKTFGGSDDDRAAAIIQTKDSGFAVLGFSKSSDEEVSKNKGSQDLWLIKLSNNGNLLWEKSYGFSGADYGNSLIETADGGFLLTGVLDVSASNGQGNAKSSKINHAGGDYWVLKTDNSGILEWSTFFGGSFTETPFGVVETADKDFIIVGSSDSNDFNITNNKGTYDFWLTKVSSTGKLIWEKSFGGTEIEEAAAITNSNDGNFIVVGNTRSSNIDVSNNNGAADVWILKISTEGNLIWEKSFGGTSFDVAKSVFKTTDNGFIIAGSSRSLDNNFTNNGQNDALLIKIDSDGELLWQKTFGGSEIDFLYDAIQLNNGAFIGVGESSSSDKNISKNKGFTDALIIKIN